MKNGDLVRKQAGEMLRRWREANADKLRPREVYAEDEDAAPAEPEPDRADALRERVREAAKDWREGLPEDFDDRIPF